MGFNAIAAVLLVILTAATVLTLAQLGFPW